MSKEDTTLHDLHMGFPTLWLDSLFQATSLPTNPGFVHKLETIHIFLSLGVIFRVFLWFTKAGNVSSREGRNVIGIILYSKLLITGTMEFQGGETVLA